MFHLDHKVALVTGAASGIGAAIAAVFAEAGAHVYVTDRDDAGARAQTDAILASGGSATMVRLDVTSELDCVQASAGVSSREGHLDILVNNAGIGAVGTILDTSPEDLDRMYAVNVRGLFNVTRAFLPAMVNRKTGSVISLASVGGIVGIRDRFAYCMTKFAVVGMTKCMALDHAEAGIRFNCICPGRVETPFVHSRLREYADPAAAFRDMVSTQLFKRLIHPEEVAAAAVFLASDESRMITGTALMLDCGWTAGK
jgi:NAD(P)-dependent dehydrogenase (short-subunit alcohol dehydrogenase family)